MPTLHRRLRPALALAVVAGLAGFAALGSCSKDTPVTASLVVEPSPLDFGDVVWLDSPRRTVTIRNRSDHEVMLRNPKFTCSCFAILTPLPAMLRPGGSTTFVVQMWSRMGTPGRFHKSMTIETDDPMLTLVETPVIGSIIDYRSVDPTQVLLGAIEEGADPVVKTVKVRGGSGFVVSVASAAVSDPRLKVEVKAVADGADVTIRTLAKPTKGFVSSLVKLELDVGPVDGVKHRYTENVRVSGEFK